LKPGGILLIRSNASRCGDGEASRENHYRCYSLNELQERVARSGFRVERLTYANTLSIWLEIFYPRRSASPGREHADHGLRIRCLPPGFGWLNAMLLLILRAEAWYLRKPGRALSAGRSTMCVARKPVSDSVSRSWGK
jgi:hypothetical protein